MTVFPKSREKILKKPAEEVTVTSVHIFEFSKVISVCLSPVLGPKLHFAFTAVNSLVGPADGFDKCC